jgi:hypothetical protein
MSTDRAYDVPGVYVPTLAEAIVEATILGTWEGAPLKGRHSSTHA